MLALVHPPSPQLATGQRTHVAREQIIFSLAQTQHAAYCQALAACGAKVRSINANRDEPDGVFLEDTAIVLDEVAVLCSMGAEPRRREPLAMEPVLGEYREVRRIALPAAIEGGDVLRIGRKLLVGMSSRTNVAGIDSLVRVVTPLGYSVTAVPVHGCLHLKTACTALPDGRLLVNPAWIDLPALAGHELFEIPESEPWAANTLPIGQQVILPAAHLWTADFVHRLGFEPVPVDVSEFSKAEGGVTCLSLILDGPGDER
ncbi:MAG: arginine deiminase family protein [Planctomycetaceae bacterium]|nr:arginine deiminase family protein [Planctomycetaceae bacterium]